MSTPGWDWCHEHHSTTLAEDADTYGCGCPINPSSRPGKGDA